MNLEAVDGDGEWWIIPADRPAWDAWKSPTDPCCRLVSALDGMFLHRRDVTTMTNLTADQARRLEEAGIDLAVGGLQDLGSNAILDRGCLVGLWEFDPDSGSIAWHAWEGDRDAITQEVRRTEVFARDQLGDVRSMSLDSPKSRAPRIAALRALG